MDRLDVLYVYIWSGYATDLACAEKWKILVNLLPQQPIDIIFSSYLHLRRVEF